MTFEQMRLVFVVYTSAILPLFIVPYLQRRALIPAWVLRVYIGSFLACALGWELWFTYGWVAGDPVTLRRAEVLNAAIPLHLNWVLNSLADAGSICLVGLWLMWRSQGRDSAVFSHWHWGAFSVLMLWCLGQNVFVEMFLYYDQLAEGKALSWAPLVPTGPWFNPTLFQFNDRTITFQGQVAWLIMGPLLYAGVILTVRRFDGSTIRRFDGPTLRT
jgi:hypothetical protein